MDDQNNAVSYLESTITTYNLSGANGNWQKFWQKYYSFRLSFQEADLNQFINARCQEISHFLSFLNKENPTAKKFLELPLNHSKTTFDWPPTSEQIKLLMSD